MTKMNPEVKAKWLERLRDGRRQVAGLLQTKNGQCCLGVLCEIAAEEGVVEVKKDDYAYRYGESIRALPPEVSEWAGLKGVNPSVEYRRTDEGFGFASLAKANDSGLSFNEIAKIIEEEL